MPSIATETVYEVTADFETPVTLDFTVDEFHENGQSTGLKPEQIQKRKFIVAEDCNASRRGYPVELKKGKEVRDVALAWDLIKQRAPLIIRDTLLLKQGDVVPDSLGKALAAEKLPVKAAKKKVEADAE